MRWIVFLQRETAKEIRRKEKNKEAAMRHRQNANARRGDWGLFRAHKGIRNISYLLEKVVGNV